MAPTQHDRMSLAFSDGYAKSGKALAQGAATAASNQEHPESAVLLERGDAVVFLVPIGNWPAEKVPSEEISVSIQQELEIVGQGTDYTEVVGLTVSSENTLSLPAPPARADVH